MQSVPILKDFILRIAITIFSILVAWTLSRFGRHIQEIYRVPLWKIPEVALRGSIEEKEDILYNFIFRLPYYPSLFIFLYSYACSTVKALIAGDIEKSQPLKNLRREYDRKRMLDRLSMLDILLIISPIIISIFLPITVLFAYYAYFYESLPGNEFLDINMGAYLVTEFIFIMILAICPLTGYYESTAMICRRYPVGRSVYESISRSYWILLVLWFFMWLILIKLRPNVLLTCLTTLSLIVLSLYITWRGISRWISFFRN